MSDHMRPRHRLPGVCFIVSHPFHNKKSQASPKGRLGRICHRYAVPPKLKRRGVSSRHAHQYVRRFGNGNAPRRGLLTVQPALESPFTPPVAAALSPSAALSGRPLAVLLFFLIGFSMDFLHYTVRPRTCQVLFYIRQPLKIRRVQIALKFFRQMKQKIAGCTGSTAKIFCKIWRKKSRQDERRRIFRGCPSGEQGGDQPAEHGGKIQFFDGGVGL